MKMVVPDILIAGGSIVLSSGDSLALERSPHRLRQTTRGTKELSAEIIRHVEYVLVVAPRYHQAVTLYSSVVVGRDEGEYIGIHQDNG